MAKLIPGRVRNQGIALYQEGKFELVSHEDGVLVARVEGYEVAFSLDTADVTCQCAEFQQKGYCQHQAALEYFMKNDAKGKALVSEMAKKEAEQEATQKVTSFGSRFLDYLALNEDDTLRYQLWAVGEESPYTQEIWWTLRLRRLPDERTYIIRDIKAFLSVVEKEGHYQIGKSYYEALSLLHFDAASQDLITFLWRLFPSSDRSDKSQLLPHQARYLQLPYAFFEKGLAYLQSLAGFSLHYHQRDYTKLKVKDLEASDGLFHFKVEVHRQFIELVIAEKQAIVLFDYAYLFYQGTVYRLDRRQKRLVSQLKTLPIEVDLSKHLHFQIEEQSKLAASLLDFQEVGSVSAPKSFAIQDFEPRFTFSLLSTGEIGLQVVYDYGNQQVISEEERVNLPFASHFKREAQVKRLLAQEGFVGDFRATHPALTKTDIYDFFELSLPRFERVGKVTLASDLASRRVMETPQIEIARQGSLLDISFDFSMIPSDEVAEAMVALSENAPYFVSQSGQLVVFDEETTRVAQVLHQLRGKAQENGHLSLDSLASYQMLEVLKDSPRVAFSKEFEQLAYDLTHPEDFTFPDVKVKASLRDYQRQGIKWLSMLDHYGFGGILADDMGLGKTLQTISFLSSRLTKDMKVLILSPSSLIYNWKDEFEKFAPHLEVMVSYGLKSVRDEVIQKAPQVMITSYTSFRQDIALYEAYSYDYLILDEAQVMKNTQTKIAQHLRSFKAKRCFALSGTPIENKLLEIWSIFQIILPGLLPSKQAFMKLEAKEVARYIKPFVLRRRKEDVLPELPELIEMTYTNELVDRQKAIYLAQLHQMQESIRGASDQAINQKKIEILSGITRLRQICDTPALFMDYPDESGKIQSLRELLRQIKENGHRALVFSQFRGMLDIAEKELEAIGLTSYKITGSTPADERQAITRAFNNGSKDLVLISLKAGGVGLNLTGADTVVLIDLWWNPAVEMQAISRAHRLGQRQNVEVYRLITRGTIEEKILALQESKKNLVTTVLDGDETRSSMTVDEIKAILGLSSD